MEMSLDMIHSFGYKGPVENFDDFIRTHPNLSIVQLIRLLFETRSGYFAQCIVDNKDVQHSLIGTVIVVLIAQKFDCIEVYEVLTKRCYINYQYFSRSLIDENIYTSNNEMFNVCITVFGKKFANSYIDKEGMRNDLTDEMKEMLKE